LGSDVADRFLIVNADDFGRSEAVNRGIAIAHTQGIVTSASLMVRWPAANAAATYAAAHRELSVGLHIDLAEWSYENDRWRVVYETPEPIEAEVHRQLATFRALMGCDPTHVDSHQHVHRSAPASVVIGAVAVEMGVPLREAGKSIRYCGDFYGQTGKGEPYHRAITVEALTSLIERLPPGITELGCHPAESVDFETTYGIERLVELRVLCDPRVRAALLDGKVELVSHIDVAKLAS